MKLFKRASLTLVSGLLGVVAVFSGLMGAFALAALFWMSFNTFMDYGAEHLGSWLIGVAGVVLLAAITGYLFHRVSHRLTGEKSIQ